jgi:hypothetical protein
VTSGTRPPELQEKGLLPSGVGTSEPAARATKKNQLSTTKGDAQPVHSVCVALRRISTHC